MDNNNYELDYKAMFENLYKLFEEKFATEIEYFELLAAANSNTKAATIVSNNLMKMSMADQVLVLRQLKAMNDVCAILQKKYNFEGEESDVS